MRDTLRLNHRSTGPVSLAATIGLGHDSNRPPSTHRRPVNQLRRRIRRRWTCWIREISVSGTRETSFIRRMRARLRSRAACSSDRFDSRGLARKTSSSAPRLPPSTTSSYNAFSRASGPSGRAFSRDEYRDLSKLLLYLKRSWISRERSPGGASRSSACRLKATCSEILTSIPAGSTAEKSYRDARSDPHP